MSVSRAAAFLRGRDYVVPDDVQSRRTSSHCGVRRKRRPSMAGRLRSRPSIPERPAALVLPEDQGTPVLTPQGKAVFGEDYDLRAFQPGDSPRTIHWKMSAKRDELVAREFLENKRPVPVLTFDSCPALPPAGKTASWYPPAAEAVRRGGFSQSGS